MKRRGTARLTIVLVALVIVSLAASSGLGYLYFQQASQVSTLQTKVSSDEGQISNLLSQVTTLQSQAATLQSQATSLQSQVTSQAASLQSLTGTQQAQATSLNQVQGSLQSVQGQLSSITSELSTHDTDLVTITQQLRNVSATVQALKVKLSSLTPQVPLSTLVVTGSSYSNVTSTYTFQVQNTQTFAVYAQLGASFYGNACQFYAGEGSYMSQVYAFAPNSHTTVSVNFKSVTFTSSSFCGKEPIAYFTMNFVASSVAVSPTYTLYVVPGYQF